MSEIDDVLAEMLKPRNEREPEMGGTTDGIENIFTMEYGANVVECYSATKSYRARIHKDYLGSGEKRPDGQSWRLRVVVERRTPSYGINTYDDVTSEFVWYLKDAMKILDILWAQYKLR
jgi:hypothetical protein